MSVPEHAKSEAHRESRPPGRQQAFSIVAEPEWAAGHPSGKREALPPLEAGPGELSLLSHRNRLWAIARDPYCLYCYWQLAFPVHRIPGAGLALAVYRRNGEHETTRYLSRPAGTCFLDVARPGAEYRLTLGFLPHRKFSREEMLFVITEKTVCTPRDYPIPRPEVEVPLSGVRDYPIPGPEVPMPASSVLSLPIGHSPPLLAILFPGLAAFARRERGATRPPGSPSGPLPPNS